MSKRIEPTALEYRDQESDRIETKAKRENQIKRIEIAIAVASVAGIVAVILYVWLFFHGHS
jgi:LPS O-antigen subunit length determinant protein (WzzB/FepE family)